jgi:hypothetical protein
MIDPILATDFSFRVGGAAAPVAGSLSQLELRGIFNFPASNTGEQALPLWPTAPLAAPAETSRSGFWLHMVASRSNDGPLNDRSGVKMEVIASNSNVRKSFRFQAAFAMYPADRDAEDVAFAFPALT